MVRALSLDLGGWEAKGLEVICGGRRQIWHLSVQLAQKSCKGRGKTLWLPPGVPVQRIGSSATMASPASGPSGAPLQGDDMAARSWFYASEGQQQGPYPEIQLRELIARGTITPDTLVWTEGMANWQKAAEIPGLAPGASGPPVLPRSGGVLPSVGGHGDGSLSIDFEIWDFVWRSLVLLIGLIFIIPAPWALVWYIKWLVYRACTCRDGRISASWARR
jgi:hypothetical protein